MSPGLIFAIVALVLLVIFVVVFLFRKMMEQPLYKPGMVRQEKNLRGPLQPPEQTDDPDFWIVEEDIELFHFAVGSGRDVLILHGGPGYPYRQPWTGLDALKADFRFHYYDQRGCGRSSRPIDRFAEGNN